MNEAHGMYQVDTGSNNKQIQKLDHIGSTKTHLINPPPPPPHSLLLLSLPYSMIIHSLFPLTQVEGIVGTYIANRKTPGSQYGATVISFDKGGAWNFLTPPTVTSGGAPIICSLVSESTSSPLCLLAHSSPPGIHTPPPASVLTSSPHEQ